MDNETSQSTLNKTNEGKKVDSDSEDELLKRLIKTSTPIKKFLSRHPLEGMFQDSQMVREFSKGERDNNIVPMPDDLELETFISEYDDTSSNSNIIDIPTDEEWEIFCQDCKC